MKLSLFVLMTLALSAAAGTPPYLDPNLDVEKRIDDLLPRLSTREKIDLCRDFHPAVGDYGIPGFVRGEALRGLVHPKHNEVTVWPAPICLAGSFSPELIYEMCEMTADEGRAQRHNGPKDGPLCYGLGGPLLVYSPNLNMSRDPRWGRNTETYGEDPFLTGRLGVAFVKGLQGDHPDYLKLAAAPKHFVCNNVEDNRYGHNAVVSERWLRDYYLKGFMPAFLEADPAAVMTAYNAINGVPCAANAWLVRQVLRQDWGWQGVAMEDACATMFMASEDTDSRNGNHHFVKTYAEASALSLQAGLDFMLSHAWQMELEQALSDGLVNEEELDRALRQVMRMRIRLGELDPEERIPWSTLPFETLACDKHTAHAREAAQQSMVLLKNDGLLPLDRNRIKRIAVVGPHANTQVLGMYAGNPKHVSTIASGLKKVAGDGVQVDIAGWQSGRTEDLINTRYSQTIGPDGIAGWKVDYFANLDLQGEPVATRYVPAVEMLHYWDEAGTLKALPEGVPLRYSARFTADIVAPETGLFKLNAFFEDAVRLEVDGKEILNFPGVHWRIERRGAIDMVKGQTYRFVLEYANLVDASGYQLLWEKPSAGQGLEFDEVELARQADVVVAALGLVDRDEGEGYDRFLDRLADDQMEMLKKVLAVNENVAVVLIGGSPVSDPELYEIAPAVLQAWYPGQSANAVADLLYGVANPSGHLPVTIARSWKDLPDKDDYEIHHGRTYMYFDKEPAYPFGHGLSYTDFDFADFKLDRKELGAADTLTVSCSVHNTGKVAGSDVVQIYARESVAQPERPKRRLVGFLRVADLQPGEKREVTIPVKIQDLAYWNQGEHAYQVPAGKWTVELGESSAEIVASTEIAVK